MAVPSAEGSSPSPGDPVCSPESFWKECCDPVTRTVVPWRRGRPPFCFLGTPRLGPPSLTSTGDICFLCCFQKDGGRPQKSHQREALSCTCGRWLPPVPRGGGTRAVGPHAPASGLRDTVPGVPQAPCSAARRRPRRSSGPPGQGRGAAVTRVSPTWAPCPRGAGSATRRPGCL